MAQANGEVERQNRSLLKALKIAQAEKKNLKVEMRKFLTAYRTTPHSSTGVSPAKLLFNREIRSKIPDLTKCEYIDSEARDRDAEMTQKRTDYADERGRGAQDNSLAPGDEVLAKQRKENKLSTTFEDAPYKVINKYGNEVTVTSPEGVNYKRNVTEVKKYLKASNGPDQRSTGDSVTGGAAESEVPELPLRLTKEKKTPEYLNDYELY